MVWTTQRKEAFITVFLQALTICNANKKPGKALKSFVTESVNGYIEYSKLDKRRQDIVIFMRTGKVWETHYNDILTLIRQLTPKGSEIEESRERNNTWISVTLPKTIAEKRKAKEEAKKKAKK